MDIRKATEEDIPAIVQLLKSSLGDISSTKSVEYWRWKHVINPFGASPVLVAEEEGMLLGVRALMRWDWREQINTYKALRAVDTATHPDHQGKGIFKKLTMQLVNNATEEGFDFIFNSPNNQSTPGYLKMGWEIWGKMPLWIHPVLVTGGYKSDVFDYYHQQLVKTDINTIEVQQDYGAGLSTVLSPAFFQWRYQLCPVKKYGLCQTENLILFFGVKEKKGGMELRVCHYLFKNKKDVNELLHISKQIAHECGCRFVTITGLGAESSFTKLIHGFVNARRISIMLTIRELANKSFYDALKTKNNWLLQSGDIELF